MSLVLFLFVSTSGNISQPDITEVDCRPQAPSLLNSLYEGLELRVMSTCRGTQKKSVTSSSVQFTASPRESESLHRLGRVRFSGGRERGRSIVASDGP